MTIDEQKEVLKIFVESTEELVTSSFVKQATQRGLRTDLTWRPGGFLATERTGPDRETVKAFLLTIRFFCQNNERTSIRKMERMISRMVIDQELKSSFSQLRDQLNRHLDSEPSIHFQKGDKALTRRDIFETFLYGTFAHANPIKHRKVKLWSNQAGLFDDLRMVFDVILLDFLRSLNAVANICRQILKRLPP